MFEFEADVIIGFDYNYTVLIAINDKLILEMRLWLLLVNLNRGFVILGYVICTDRQTISENDSERFFRIGSMGDIYEDDMRALTNSIRQVCCDMNIDLPLLSHEY